MTWFLDKKFLEGLDLRAYDAGDIATRVGLPVETVQAFVGPNRLYMVKSCPEYGWLAGADEDGRPTLLFVGSPRIAAANEQLLNAVTFDIPGKTFTTRAIDLEDLVEDEEALDWEGVLAAAEAEIGFVHIGSAPVLAFKHPEIWHYAVVPFPFHLHDDAVGQGDGDVDGVREWIAAGSFVLHCGNAYFMSADGEVESS